MAELSVEVEKTVAAGESGPLFDPTKIVAVVTLTNRNIHVTCLPTTDGIPAEYLYATEGAIGHLAADLWRIVMEAAGAKVGAFKKVGIIQDHEEGK